MKSTRGWWRIPAALALMLAQSCAKGNEPVTSAKGDGYDDLEPDQIIARVRENLFTGPIAGVVDSDALDPAGMPDAAQLGVSARWGYDPPVTMAFLRAAGLKWLRLGVGTNPGAVTQVLDMARRYDINVIAMLGYGPVADMPPGKLADWYLQRSIPLVQEHRDVIKAAQIWNEPFNFPKVERKGKRISEWVATYGGRWHGGPYVGPFGRFTAATAKGLRKAFPDLTLVGGTKEPGSTLEMLEEHPAPLDAVYMQPYPRRWPPELLRGFNSPEHKLGEDYSADPAIATVLSRARRVTGNPDLELWITEIGATTYVAEKGTPPGHHPPVSELMQAKIYARIWASYLSAGVARVFYYVLNDDRQTPSKYNPKRHFTMIGPGWRPKPAYFTLARLNAMTRGQVFPDPGIDPQVRGADKLPARRQSLKAHRNSTFTRRTGLVTRGLRTADGGRILAFWDNSALPDDNQEVREAIGRISIGLDSRVWSKAMIVDPLTGDSALAKARREGERVWIDVDVWDYPLLIYAP